MGSYGTKLAARGAIALVLVSAGCAAEPAGEAGTAGGRAQRLYAQTYTLLERQELVVRLHKTEVLVDGIPVPEPVSSQWGGSALPGLAEDNPAGMLRVLQPSAKAFRLEAGGGERSLGQTLTVELSKEDWTRLVKNSWDSKLSSLQEQGPALIKTQLSKASTSHAEALQRELNIRLQAASDKLSQALQTLAADGTCKLRFGSGGRPETLLTETRLQYMEDGARREETVRSFYEFRRKGLD